MPRGADAVWVTLCRAQASSGGPTPGRGRHWGEAPCVLKERSEAVVLECVLGLIPERTQKRTLAKARSNTEIIITFICYDFFFRCGPLFQRLISA